MDYGLQLFSIRDMTEKDFEGALKAVSQIGYKMVEFAGFFGHSATEIADMLHRYGLTVSGTHTGWQEIAEQFAETVDYHKKIGNQNIIIPGADLDCQEKIDQFVEMINEFQPKLEAEGILLHYHNHDHEFRPNQDGSVIYDQLRERTNLYFELDTYWIYAAKKDPLALMESLKDRVKVIHLKDGSGSNEGNPLGQGTAPVKAVLEKAIQLGMTVIVESETLTPDGLSEAKICMDFLQSIS